MAGESGDLWQQCTTSVEEWARSMECDSMEVMGRKGMVHKLKPVGYEQKYIVARKAL